jgi:hypothetical protein
MHQLDPIILTCLMTCFLFAPDFAWIHPQFLDKPIVSMSYTPIILNGLIPTHVVGEIIMIGLISPFCRKSPMIHNNSN